MILLAFLFLLPCNLTEHKSPTYYEKIYLAEKHLCDSEYIAACRNYQSAFKIQSPFYADLRNAFKAALLSKEEKRIKFFWSLLAKKPDLANYFKTSPIGRNLLSASMMEDIASYNQIRQTTPLEHLFDSVRKVDQSSRQNCNNNNPNCMKLFAKTDSANIKYLANLLKSIDYKEDVYGEAPIEVCFLVAWHARRWGYTDLDTILLENIKNGKIKPQPLAQLISYRSDIDSINKKFLSTQPMLGLSYTGWIINNRLVELNVPDSVLNRINKERQVYLMDDIRNDVGKQLLTLRNSMFSGARRDLGLETFASQMGEEEFKKLIGDLGDKLLKKVW